MKAMRQHKSDEFFLLDEEDQYNCIVLGAAKNLAQRARNDKQPDRGNTRKETLSLITPRQQALNIASTGTGICHDVFRQRHG